MKKPTSKKSEKKPAGGAPGEMAKEEDADDDDDDEAGRRGGRGGDKELDKGEDTTVKTPLKAVKEARDRIFQGDWGGAEKVRVS